MALCFLTETEVPREALTLLGATTKADDETKLGFYGTGFKYAISVFMREGIEFGLRVNGEEFQFTTRPAHLKDITYDVIHIDGRETSLTTRMGVEWKLWHAIREVWQNTVDENGTIHFDWRPENSNAGSVFWISTEDMRVQEVVSQWNDYFTDQTLRGPIQKDQLSPCKMYKFGMRVTAEDAPLSLFDYGVNQYTRLNEMRLVDNDSIKYKIKSMSEQFKADDWRKIFLADRNTESIEWQAFMFGHYGNDRGLYNFLKDYRLYPTGYKDVVYDEPPALIIPDLWYESMQQAFGDELNFATNTVGSSQVICEKCQAEVETAALDVWRSTGFGMPYEINIVDFADEHIMGQALRDKDTIFISHHLVHENHTLELYATLLEEMMHLSAGVDDCTREMQELLLKMAAKGIMGKINFKVDPKIRLIDMNVS